MRHHVYSIAILCGFVCLLIACNLGTSDTAPPTLASRPTLTPPATLGYVAAGPARLPGIGSSPEPPAEQPRFELGDEVESDRLMTHIRILQDFGSRHVNSAQHLESEGIGAAQAYLSGQFETYRQAADGRLYTFDLPFESITPDGERRQQTNLVAVIQGTETDAGAILVGAHYDSVGAPLDDSSAYAPGANDNASGVAATLEMARIMSRARYKATVMFALFSAEEWNRQGSKAFAAWLRDDGADLIGMVNLDTIGNVHDRGGLVNDREMRVFSAGPNESSESRRLARMVNFIAHNSDSRLDLVVQDAIDRENRYGDHFSFSELGFPAIRLINAHEEKFNGDPTDTIEFIEAGYLREATAAILTVVSALADGPRPPDDIVLRSGGISQELVWQPVPKATGYIIALRSAGGLYYQRQIVHGETSLSWDGFADYSAIAIAATDSRGLVGPLSREITLR